jgi:hypothetical protein
MVDRINMTDEQRERARQMNLLFNNPNKQTYGDATDAILGEKEEPVYSSFAERRAAEQLKSIQEKKKGFKQSEPSKPLSFYERRKKDWVSNPESLTLEDEIKLAYGAERYKDLIIDLYDEDYKGDDESRQKHIRKAIDYYENNFRDIESFDLENELDLLREKYKDNDDIKNFQKYVRNSSLGSASFATGSSAFLDSENFSKNLWLDDSKTTRTGKKQWQNFINQKKYNNQRAIDNIQDAPRLAARSVATAARDIGSLPDGAAYLLGAAGNWGVGMIGSLNPLSDMSYEESISGWHKSGLGKTLDAVGDFLGPSNSVSPLGLFGVANVLEETGEGILDSRYTQYEAYLKDNPNVAENLEFIGSVAATLPFEIAAAGIYANKISNPKIMAQIRQITQDGAVNPIEKTQRALLMAHKRMGDRIEFAGMQKVLNQEKRAIYAANTAIVGTHLGVQGVESKFDLEDNAWWNGAKIPLYFGTAMFAASSGPKAVDAIGAKLGITDRKGPPTIMNQIKFWANNARIMGGVDKVAAIDKYLTDAMKYEPSMLKNMTLEQKYKLTGMTRREYKAMEDLGIAFRDVKRLDEESIGTANPTNHYGELVKGIEDTLKARNALLEVYAKTYNRLDETGLETQKSYSGTREEIIENFSKERPELANQVDVTIEDMLNSDSLRAASNALVKGNKLPMLGKFSSKTIYEDLRVATNQEVKRRQAFANVLERILPNAKEVEDVLDDSRVRFIENLKKMNEDKLAKAKDRYSQSTKDLAMERTRLAGNLNDNLNIYKKDYKLLGSRLDRDDLAMLNVTGKLFKDLGYTPGAEAREAFKNAGIKADDFIGPVEPTPLVKYATQSRRVFNKALNTAKGKIDSVYAAARESNKGKYVNVNEADETFQKIKTDLQSPTMEARKYGTNPNEYSNFRRFYFAVGQKWINRSVANENVNQLDTILKSYVKGKGEMDEAALLDAVDNYKLETMVQSGDEMIPLAEASTREYGQHLLGLLARSDKEGQNFLAVGMDLNSLQDIRSNIMARAGDAYGTPLGHQLSDLAEDLKVVLEVGSKKFMNDENYTSLIEANRDYAQNFAPLFKQGEAAQIASKSSSLQNKVPDADIMSNFFLSKDKTKGIAQFRKIFGNDTEANDLLRQGIGRHIDNGGSLDEEQVMELVGNNIISREIGDVLSPANLNKNKQFQNDILEGARARALTDFDSELDEASRGLLNVLADKDGRTNVESLYKTLTQDYTSKDFKKLLNTVNTKNYAGGQKAFKEDIKTMLTKPILDRVTTLGNDLAQETKDIILGGQKRLAELNPAVKNIATGLSNRAKRFMGKPQTSDSVLERAEWAAELDSRAFQEVLEEVGPILKAVDDKALTNLKVLSNFATRVGKGREVGKALGTVKSLSVESILSRVYSIQRGVVSTRYVVSEATLQIFRENRMKLLQKLLQEPENADLILSVIYDNGLQSYDTRVRWINFMRSWAGFTGEEMSDEELLEQTRNKLFDYPQKKQD